MQKRFWIIPKDINDSPGPGAYSAFNKSSVIRETPSIGAKGLQYIIEHQSLKFNLRILLNTHVKTNKNTKF